MKERFTGLAWQLREVILVKCGGNVFATGKTCKDRKHPHDRLIALMENKIFIPIARHPCLIFEYEHENT